MAILIVDDEESIRETLRLVLTQLGHKTILEARNGEEALRLIDAEKTRIRLIISDWEMPYLDGITFADRLEEREALNFIPFLLISSDLPDNKLSELKQLHPRIDHAIFKPFRAKMLEQALGIASANRMSKRDTLLWIGTNPPQQLVEALSSQQKDAIYRSLSTDKSCKNFGCVLVASTPEPTKLCDWSALRKSAIGTSAPWICIGRTPHAVAPFHGLCQVFVDPETLSTADQWVKLLEQAGLKLKNVWQTNALFTEAKTLIQEKKCPAARELLQRILALDPFNSESHIALAEAWIEEKNPKKAVLHELEALKLNPCLPKPYLRLLEILPSSDSSLRTEIARAATSYCPHHKELVARATEVLSESGK